MKSPKHFIEIKQRKFKFLILGFYLVTSVLQVFLLNSMSTNGSRLNSLENDIKTVSDKNDLLEEQIASASSVTTINQKALRLGLISNLPVISINSSLPVALGDTSSN